MPEEFFLADWFYDPEEDLFLTIYATRDGQQALKILRRVQVTRAGLPLKLPDDWNTYPDAVREVARPSLQFYYRQKVEVSHQRWSNGERLVKTPLGE